MTEEEAHGERLARLETQMGLVLPIVQKIAGDVQAIREKQAGDAGEKLGKFRTLSTQTAVMTACGAIGAVLAHFLPR